MSPAEHSQALGKAAEDAAAKFLKSRRYRILARNFSTRVGEIDIIAADGETLCFVEVRSRARDDSVPPHTSVGPTKQARVRAAASSYLTVKRLHNRMCRFDVLSLVSAPDTKAGWNIELLRDAF